MANEFGCIDNVDGCLLLDSLMFIIKKGFAIVLWLFAIWHWMVEDNNWYLDDGYYSDFGDVIE